MVTVGITPAAALAAPGVPAPAQPAPLTATARELSAPLGELVSQAPPDAHPLGADGRRGSVPGHVKRATARHVVIVMDRAINMSIRAGDELAFVLTPETEILGDGGRPITPEALPQGRPVRVAYTIRGGRAVANRVVIQPGPAVAVERDAEPGRPAPGPGRPGLGEDEPLPAPPRRREVPGHVVRLSADQLALVTDRDISVALRKGTGLSFVLTPETRYQSMAPERVGTDIQPGDTVVVRYREFPDRLLAEEVRLLSTRGRVNTLPPPRGSEEGSGPRDTPRPKPPAAEGDAYAQGIRLYEEGQERAAVEAFSRAIAGDPGRAEAFLGRGKARHALREYALALEDFNTALGLRPDDEDTYLARGKTYRALRQPERAIGDFTSAIRANPQSGKGYFERAHAYQMFYVTRPRTALQDLDEAIRREPRNATYYNRRGGLFYETNTFARAIADFDRAISFEPTLAVAYGNRGLAHFYLDRKTMAAADFRQCLVLDPSLRPWLEQQVQVIPQVRQWQADFQRWYAEVLKAATSARDDYCGSKYAGHQFQIDNCRSHGVNDTEDKVRKGQL